MAIIVEIFPYILLAGWCIFSIIYLVKAKRTPDDINPYIFDSIPQIFPTIGILGTFIGIAYGLWFFDVNNIEESIPALLNGLKTAFIASIFGIIFSIIFSKLTAYRKQVNQKGKLSTETIALNKLIGLLEEVTVNLNDNFIYTDENNNKIKPANFFRDIYEESRKQSNALQSFSTDLADTIGAGFERILNDPNKGVTHELQELKIEFENLGKKLKDPATEMTQNIVKDLQLAMGTMIEEFKTSVSGSTKSELEQLTILLSKAGGSLTDFPSKLQQMTENLNENFKGLQEVVQQISSQTLSQSEQSTGQMQKQVEEMSKILTAQVGGLQKGQEVLIEKQSENLGVSEQLLNVFNKSIKEMNGLSVEVTGTITEFSRVQKELNSAAQQFKLISENIISSSSQFKEGQLKFSQHSNEFLKNNSETIQQIQRSLSTAKDVSSDYAQKFTVIDKGLEGIFNQIETGLHIYRDTVGESLELYLRKYTDALTKTAESLAGATSKQEDILEELTEQLSKLNTRRN